MKPRTGGPIERIKSRTEKSKATSKTHIVPPRIVKVYQKMNILENYESFRPLLLGKDIPVLLYLLFHEYSAHP